MKYPWRKPEPVASPPPLDDRDWLMVSPRALFASRDPAVWEGRCRRLTFSTYLGDDTVLCRALARFKMYVSTRDLGLGPHLIGEGYWELWITCLIARLVQPGMVCIDAGANVGYYTLLMAELAGPDGRVIAAEPVPATRALLTRNVDLNGFGESVSVLAAGFSDRPGEVSVYVPPGEPKNAMVVPACPPGWEEVRTPMLPIDDLGLPRVDFVKIDVEGHEIAVWQGMQQTIAANPAIQIVMEVNCARYPDAAAFITQIEAIFSLRCIDFFGDHVPISREDVLSSRYDVMLYLSRGPDAST